jgi:hypothetical protein
MFDQKALEYLVGLGKVQVIEINDQKYSPVPLNHVRLPKVEPIKVNSLTGLVDYLESKFDDDAFIGKMVHVVSHDCVKLVSNILGDAGREVYMTAEAFAPKFNFGQWYDVESFIIAMQSCFVQNEDSAKILRVVGNIKEEAVKQTGDDGVSQKVTAKTGIATVEEVKVPNPVILAPYRIFREIEQPESKFVFRMQMGPRCALFEADGGAWRLNAMARIKEWLEIELEGLKIPIIS